MSCQSLAAYITDSHRRDALAAETGAHPQWLWQIASGWKEKKASKMLALAIERATAGLVSRYDLRPDVFGPSPTEQKAAA